MKKWTWIFAVTLAALCVCASAGADVAIDETNFPDENFRSCVARFDRNGDGIFSDEELGRVTEIECERVADLTGIGYFTALTRLYCTGNRLTEIDLSRNTALTELYCGKNRLTALDVSGNTMLRVLQCYENPLTELDVSRNTALTVLDCGYNDLAELDVRCNTSLVYLICQGNRLTELDLRSNAALTLLACGGNLLTELDVSGNTALAALMCHNNRLTELNLKYNTGLTELYCAGNLLTALDVSRNTAMTQLYCAGNLLTELDVSRNTALTELSCEDNRLNEMDLSFTPNLFAAVLYGAKTEGEYAEYILDYNYFSADSRVTVITVPSSYLLLPADLTAAEDEAFLNIRADAVIVPPGVASIGANAFPAGVRIYGPASSAAMTWAAMNECAFFPCTEEWIAALR